MDGILRTEFCVRNFTDGILRQNFTIGFSWRSYRTSSEEVVAYEVRIEGNVSCPT
jgi:hypothetical protein